MTIQLNDDLRSNGPFLQVSLSKLSPNKEGRSQTEKCIAEGYQRERR